MKIYQRNLVLVLIGSFLPGLVAAEEPLCVQTALENNKKIIPPLQQAIGNVAFKKAMASKKYTYSGNAKCRLCHRDFFIGRKGDVHDHAYEKLVAAYPEHAENPRCLSCHTTGHGVRTGFKSMKRTAKLANVQCEGCHGPGLVHIRRQIVKMPAGGLTPANTARKKIAGGFLAGTDKPKKLKKMCKSCHTNRWNSNANKFKKEYNSYKTAKPSDTKKVIP